MSVSFCSDWEAAAATATAAYTVTEDVFTSSEVSDALIGFLEPGESTLLPLNDLFDPADAVNAINTVNNVDTNIPSSASPPGGCCFNCYARIQRNCPDLYFAAPVQSSPLPFEPSSFAPVFNSPASLLPPPLNTAEGGNGGSSVQSMAARERRKRISDKTKELSRLVPGGAKMSTAEMLTAAHKYVKYLQAQIGILGFMTSTKVRTGAGEELLQVLIASPFIQERLSSEGLCLVPKEVVDESVANPHLNLNHFIDREMAKFTETAPKMK